MVSIASRAAVNMTTERGEEHHVMCSRGQVVKVRSTRFNRRAFQTCGICAGGQGGGCEGRQAMKLMLNDVPFDVYCDNTECP